jgi:putative oxidoreductase
MSEFDREPNPVLPALQPFYDLVRPWTWPLVRFGCGWLLIVHGYGKILRGMAAQAQTLTRSGFDWGISFSAFLTVVELGGGICIVLGLFTRFWAAAIAIEMGVLTFYLYWGNGFSWVNRGYEFTLLWGIVALAIALRGGGPYSLDRRIGREL